MIEIREAQMRAFEQAARTNFHKRLRATFREQFPDQTRGMDDAELLGRIVAADETAQTYGIETQQGVARFAALSITAGPDFHTLPPVTKFLTYPGLAPDDRMELLTEQLAEYKPQPK